MNAEIYFANIEKIKTIDVGFFEEYFPERLKRSMGFRFEDDRLRSLAVGYLLNTAMGASERDISVGEYGKPYIPGGPEFSISHSGEYAVLAVCENTVGVDIEKPNNKRINVAKRVFATDELEWASADPEERFWPVWTMKEAVGKVTGKGLLADFRSFSVLPLIGAWPPAGDKRFIDEIDRGLSGVCSPVSCVSVANGDERRIEYCGKYVYGNFRLFDGYALSVATEGAVCNRSIINI